MERAVGDHKLVVDVAQMLVAKVLEVLHRVLCVCIHNVGVRDSLDLVG